MLLFPTDINSLLAHLDEQLALDEKLRDACRPLIESENYAELIGKAVTVLANRISQKSGAPAGELASAAWAERIDWGTAGIDKAQSQHLAALCDSLLNHAATLRPSAKSARALLLMADVLLTELDRLPDLSAPKAELDATPFFKELVQSLNSLLPYEQRDFPAEIAPTKAKLLLFSLPENAYYAVEIIPPAGDEVGRLEMGIHFEGDDLETLTNHFRRKIPSLSHSLGGKEIVFEENEERTSILLHQPFQPAEKMSAFMTAATLVGLIGSIQERMPRR